MRASALAAPVLFVMLLASGEAATSRKKSLRMVNKRRNECEMVTCRGLEEEDPNCTPRCVSEHCFAEVYGGNELEPGEIDTKRSRQFTRCARNEATQKVKEDQMAKQRKRAEEDTKRRQQKKQQAEEEAAT
uniref:Uncharacterized protein n=1 Tax=Lotharella oceanica TaxID=641309 RepID=A0A7S2TYE2_9EUKA|mmetsp:Transcript_32800/g.60991  ORF Transcript_32800/g.60991 Transcript_32800/m.60991 type:complete len:131 (-) Transcript_32800:121-513(-)